MNGRIHGQHLVDNSIGQLCFSLSCEWGKYFIVCSRLLEVLSSRQLPLLELLKKGNTVFTAYAINAKTGYNFLIQCNRFRNRLTWTCLYQVWMWCISNLFSVFVFHLTFSSRYTSTEYITPTKNSETYSKQKKKLAIICHFKMFKHEFLMLQAEKYHFLWKSDIKEIIFGKTFNALLNS